MSTDSLIADRIEIADLFTRFGRLLDEGRYRDAASVYTGDVTVHSPRAGTLRGIDAVADFIRRSAVDGERSRHTTTDLLVDVSGDRAAASANSLVYYYRDGHPPHRTGGLRLTSTVHRTPAGWRLDELRIEPSWVREG
ncbi:nuclear transport factor 2 family protein [Nocardia fusca]|uniref:Nuclear transport factor 2 family protein n=1 Tax=Nocardia fusca TaxID=941183 RepID=A0ABV3F0C0_9NOCA